MKKLLYRGSTCIVFFVFVMLLAIFVYVSYQNSITIRSIVRLEPIEYSYTFDGFSFLKSFYEMKKGYSFYDANYIGIKFDGRQGSHPPYISGWRMPATFVIWSTFAQNGEHIWFLFLLLSISTLWSVFFIHKKLTNIPFAFISLLFLFPYLYFALTTNQFLLIEWWSSLIFIIGVAFFVYKKYFFGITLFFLSATMREFFIIPFIIGAVYTFFDNRRIFFYFLGSIFLFILFYIVHYIDVNTTLVTYTGISVKLFGQNFGAGGIHFLRQTLAYGTQFFVTTQLNIQATSIMLIITLSGSLVVFKGKNIETKILFLSLFAFVIVFFFLGTLDNDYWGAIYMPFLIVLFPVSLKYIWLFVGKWYEKNI